MIVGFKVWGNGSGHDYIGEAHGGTGRAGLGGNTQGGSSSGELVHRSRRSSNFSRVPQMAVADSREIDSRIAILYHCMANLTFYLLESSDSKSVDRHLRYPGNLTSIVLG
jgi:hypothetical protein